MGIEPLKSRELATGQRVEVYRNLHTANLFSIRDKKTFHVLGHGTCFLVHNVYPTVSTTGRARACREFTRNVHAVLNGVYDGESTYDTGKLREIVYNPFKQETFVYRDTEEEFLFAELVYFKDGKAWVVK